MQELLRNRLLVVGLVFLMAWPGRAQQELSINQLKEQIAKLEQIDRDPATSLEVRTLNRDFLKSRRLQLQSALAKRIDDLGRYKADVASSLTAEELGKVEALISSLQADLTELRALLAPVQISEGGGIAGSSPASPVNTIPVRTAVSSSDMAADKTESAPPAAPLPQTSECTYTDVPKTIETDAAQVASDIVERNDVSRLGNVAQRSIFLTVTDALTKNDEIKVSALNAYVYIGETSRTDKQIGATAASSGSTSAAEKAGWADLLGFGVEHGAIQQRTGDTSLTLSTTPYMLVVPSEDDTAATYRKYGYLKRLGLSASFNITNKAAALTNVRRKNLSQYAAKFSLTRSRGPNSREFDDRWIHVIKPAIQEYLNSLSGGIETLVGGTNATDIQEYRNTVINTASTSITNYLTPERVSSLASDAKKKAEAKAEVKRIILCALKTQVFDEVKSDGTGKIKIDQATRDRIVGTFLPALIAARKRTEGAELMFKKILEDFERRPEASFSLTNNRPATGSEYVTFNFVYQQYLPNTPIKMTLNAGPSLYRRPDSKMNQTRFRDFITTLSFEGRRDSPFKTTILDLSQMTYSFTARYQRLQENRGVPKKKADIAVLQFKLDIPIAKGVSIPLALTYANATEQVHEQHVRGNFGFTFDADKFLVVKKLLEFTRQH